MGETKTAKAAELRYFWPGMTNVLWAASEIVYSAGAAQGDGQGEDGRGEEDRGT